MQAAHVRREQRFGLSIPMARLTQNAELARALGEAQIFVQGSIDMLLTMRDGSLILMDYKTDRISDTERQNEVLLRERMRERHGNQLICYAEAVRAFFGKAPERCCIYSLPLGRMIEM
jgi:ATP-dependent helicase/nuclease subunit A